jgi:hypothetical protein
MALVYGFWPRFEPCPLSDEDIDTDLGELCRWMASVCEEFDEGEMNEAIALAEAVRSVGESFRLPLANAGRMAQWFVTGASSGFGREVTAQLLPTGHRVAGDGPDPGRLADLVAKYPAQVWNFPLHDDDQPPERIAARWSLSR